MSADYVLAVFAVVGLLYYPVACWALNTRKRDAA